MKKSPPAISGPPFPPDNLANRCRTLKKNQPALSAQMKAPRVHASYTCRSGKLYSQFAGYLAFGAAVFASVAAAVAVASHNVPLMLGEF